MYYYKHSFQENMSVCFKHSQCLYHSAFLHCKYVFNKDKHYKIFEGILFYLKICCIPADTCIVIFVKFCFRQKTNATFINKLNKNLWLIILNETDKH